MTEQTYENWITKSENGIFWLYINRPAKKNAFSVDLTEELYKILLSVENDPEIRVMVLTTTLDDMFCAGADIEWFYTLGEPDGREASIRAQAIFRKIEQLPFPVIAGVKGLCLTAGFELMMCCDMIIAADNAQFGQIETKYALTPGGGGTQRLTRLVGPMKARELIYTARIFSAQEALDMRLINEIVPLDNLETRIGEICQSIMKNSAHAIKEAKFLVELATYTNAQGFAYENKMFGVDFGSGEPKERFEKFMKREKSS
jgi:enoyl-CoA hydratase/carnithine racemase